MSEVPAINHERPGYPNSSSSVFVDLPYLWLHELKLWDKPLTTLNAYSQYAGSESNVFGLIAKKYKALCCI